MNSKPILIAIVCGLLTAILLRAPLWTGGAGVLLALFAVLPLFVSALGFGMTCGIISAAIASAVTAVFAGPLAAVGSFLLTLAPAVWAGRMAGLARQDTDQQGVVEWFPLSTMLYRMALLCAALTVAYGWMIGFDEQNFAEQLKTMIVQAQKQIAASNPDFVPPADAELTAMTGTMAALFAPAMPFSLLVMYVTNMSLGARIARARGWMARPKDDIPAKAGLPLEAAAILAIALGLLFLGGPVGLTGKAIAGAMIAAFFLVGLAVLHAVTRGITARPFLLNGVYFLILITGFPAIFIVCAGLAETLVGIRNRFQNTTT